MFKLDLKRAYRQISICPNDYSLVAFHWQNHIFCDTVLPMGLRSSAHICQRVTNAFSYMLLNVGTAVLNYLDDFAGVEKKEIAFFAFELVRQIFKRSGLDESFEKACEPSEIMIFLGVLFNTKNMTMSIPSEKLSAIHSLIKDWRLRSHATLKDIQKLLGKLNSVAACVKSSRVFVNRILNWLRICYNQANENKSSADLFDIPTEVKKDLFWWDIFLPQYNCVSLMDLGPWSVPDALFSTDSCLTGCGGLFGNKFFHKEFPEFIQKQKLHISALELLSIIVCLHIWAPFLKGKRVQIFCDNRAACIVVNTGKAKCEFFQKCLREICFLASIYDFQLRCIHLESSENRLADCLSRWHLDISYQCNFLSSFSDWNSLENYQIEDSSFLFSNSW